MAKRIDAAQATTGKKKMSKKRKFLIALGVIAAVLVGAWVAVINPAINNLVTEQVQAAGLEGAIVEVHADGAKITLPTLPASMAGSGLDATNLVVEFGGIGVDDVNSIMEGAQSGNFTLPEGTHFSVTADALAGLTDVTVVGTEKTADLTATVPDDIAKLLKEALKGGSLQGVDGLENFPLDGIVLTPGADGTVITATIDMAQLLALLAAQN